VAVLRSSTTRTVRQFGCVTVVGALVVALMTAGFSAPASASSKAHPAHLHPETQVSIEWRVCSVLTSAANKANPAHLHPEDPVSAEWRVCSVELPTGRWIVLDGRFGDSAAETAPRPTAL
jgi:hypothetical protein